MLHKNGHRFESRQIRRKRKDINIGEVSLEAGGVIPVTKAAATLAEIMKTAGQRPTIVTQNGLPIGAILSLSLFKELRDLARQHLSYLAGQEEVPPESDPNYNLRHSNHLRNGTPQ